MSSQTPFYINIRNAKTHNLKKVSLKIPHHQFIVVTGVSGSGKSSLAFDIISNEGQRRYFETLPSFARQFMGKLSPANVDQIDGLSPVITVSQKTSGLNSRSTVGTLADINALLRLLYARSGISSFTENLSLTRSLFSFNAAEGKCLRCNGLGVEEEIDLSKLIQNSELTIREGALAPTLPTGYIMYSQVTIDVLNQVCEAEGFNVDIPWNELTDSQRNVILYGSEKIKVPFGKHSIESRLKWTGIKAKPREDGYYKGMIPIMSDILRRDRNANILKYVSAIVCKECHGKRLNETALSVKIHGQSIADILDLTIRDLLDWITNQEWSYIAAPIIDLIKGKLELLIAVGLGYLQLNQSAKSLSSSEIQRIRVINQIGSDLSNVLYVFDEPSIGLHSSENKTLIKILRSLVDKGNTVIVVEHDIETIRQADWIIDLGPNAGIEGGEIMFNGKFSDFIAQKTQGNSTLNALRKSSDIPKVQKASLKNDNWIHLRGCNEGLLEGQDFSLLMGHLNVVTGPSGSGKKDLVKRTLLSLLENKLQGAKHFINIESTVNINLVDRFIFADQSPIGRTPRSNPATYLGLSDRIRDIYAKLPESKLHNLTKSSFSFNTKGGRCETCLGAGKTQIGMHFLGQVELVCETCNGKRFNPKSLTVRYQNKTISDVYNLSINDACEFFKQDKKLLQGLKTLQKIGLGYLTLGQSSTTLSGGEAQRIKLANELQKKSTGNTLYILDEPSIGLHPFDLENLLHLFNELLLDGNTIVCIEQDELILSNANHVIELGADRTENTWSENTTNKKAANVRDRIQLIGVSTHLLKNIDVQFPKNQLTVVTGLSGSGKSALVYDSLYAEANARFSKALSTYNRSLIQSQNRAKIEHATGLTPTISIQRKRSQLSNRSTVATVTGIHDHLRLLYSRIAHYQGHDYSAQHFSFNHKLGACPQCKGLGLEKKCDPTIIIIDPKKSILNGALNSNKTAKYFTHAESQFMATLSEVARQKQWDLSIVWEQLSEDIKNTILYGTGDKEYQVRWEFKTKTRSGTQELTSKWLGFCNYIDDEYERRRDNKNIQTVIELLHDVPCSLCSGNRLKEELLTIEFAEKNIAQLCELSIADCQKVFMVKHQNKDLNAILSLVSPPILQQINTLINLGLGYITLDRVSSSLSGGESQRIRLAGQFASQLFGVTYVLDEPTIGLDEDQVKTLIQLLHQLIQRGNTVVVIEHDSQFISASDYLIEMGPSSGINGGEIMYQGVTSEIKNHPETLTYKTLLAPHTVNPMQVDQSTTPFGVKNAITNNLKGIDVTFNSNRITAVTGLSGSGKSTLLKSVFYESIRKKRPIGCREIFGIEIFDEVFMIDQKPITINALSCPASVLGILDLFQSEFAKTESAKAAKLKKADFNYQSKNGRCPNCKGYGELKTSMDFMSDVWIPCETCNGSRYHQNINNHKLFANNQQSYSIGQIIQLTAFEAAELFDQPKITARLQIMNDLGIGHLKLGQAGNTLSGGEAQRLKLAKALTTTKGQHLYLFDEPSTGLHQADILLLIKAIENLILSGDTVVFIEHNPILISVAHHQVKLGPGSGELGGEVVD